MSFLGALKALEKALEGIAKSLSSSPIDDNNRNNTVYISCSSKETLGGNRPSQSVNFTSPLNVSKSSLLQHYSCILLDLLEQVHQSIPSVPLNQVESFFLSLEKESQARNNFEEAQKALEQVVSGQTQQDKVDYAKAEVDHRQKILEKETMEAMKLSSLIIDDIFCHLPQIEHILIPCAIVMDATPEHLSNYASKGPTELEQVQSLLQNVNLMRDILEATGPKNNNYAEALRIYNSIVSKSAEQGGVFYRLALAVSLEFSDNIHIFDTTIPIDPMERYFHYETAYIEGSLDPCFSSLSIFEMRMVIDNDASNEEISWCRSMLRNYRPDLIHVESYYWKYCTIVKTDVRYKCPEWVSSPRSYEQILSGGGMCGPRAWFGRFVCKSFGVPTWGVRQPGHAALSHWMPPEDSSKDWAICLGGPNWKKSYWNNIRGEDFSLDMKARANESAHYGRVLRLLWLSKVCGHESIDNQAFEFFRRHSKGRFWSELSVMQKRILAHERSTNNNYNRRTDLLRIVTIEERIRQNKSTQANCQVLTEHIDHVGCLITIPAALFCNKSINSQKVIVMKSYLTDEKNGMQVHLRGDARLEYELTLPIRTTMAAQTRRKYSISLRVVNVSSESKPVRLGVKGDGSQDDQLHNIIIPYTRGKWQRTQPLLIELHGEMINKISIWRDDPSALGLSIKDIVLTPLQT